MRQSFYCVLVLGFALSLSACHSALTQPLATVAAPAQANWVTIIKDSGAKQCATDSPTLLSQAQQQLAAANLSVADGQCVRLKGVAYTSVCGATSGIFNAFKIPAAQLNQAKQLGFEAVATQAIEITDCPHH